MSYSISDELLKLKSLLDDGVLTKDEFEEEKRILLSQRVVALDTRQKSGNSNLFTVVLNGFPEKRRQAVMKYIRAAYEVGYEDGDRLASSLPLVIRAGIENDYAQRIAEKLRALECDVDVLNYDTNEDEFGANHHNIKENESQQVPTQITCPYCHSTNVEKITLGKKAVKGWFWGIAAASTLTKEWHCKNCKSNF